MLVLAAMVILVSCMETGSVGELEADVSIGDDACNWDAQNEEDESSEAPCKTDDNCQDLAEPCRIGLCVIPVGEGYGICNFETVAPDGVDCDDGQLCTENDDCIKGACVGTWKYCGDDNQCTKDECNSETGECVSELDPDICNKGNPCKQYWCEPSSGCAETNLQEGKPCEDGNLCTKEESCNEGECVPEDYLECEDYNPCTKDSCDPEMGCVFVAKEYGPCDDGNLCTLGDACNFEGKCTGSAELDCDDGESCTDDWCEPEEGCLHQAKQNDKPCDDGDACTLGDICQNEVCTPQDVLECEDDNPCTNDYCDPNMGCVVNNIPEGEPCADDNICTLGDSCHNGQCGSGTTLDCDDGNSCTSDLCDSETGCFHQNASDGTYCDDDPCGEGHCQDGECVEVTGYKWYYVDPLPFNATSFSWGCYEVVFINGDCGLVVNEGAPCDLVDCVNDDGEWKHVNKFDGEGTCTSNIGGVTVTASIMEGCATGCFQN